MEVVVELENHLFCSSVLLQGKYQREALEKKLLRCLPSCPSLVKFISDKEKLVRAVANINFDCLEHIDGDKYLDFDFWYKLLHTENASCFKSDKFLSKLCFLHDFNRELFLQAIRRGVNIGMLCRYWSFVVDEVDYDECWKNLTRDREMLMVAAQSGHTLIEDVGEDLLLSDRELLLTAVRNNFGNYTQLDENYQLDKETVLETLKSKTRKYLNRFPSEVFSDRDIMIASIGADSNGCLIYFDESAMEDRNLVLECVKACGNDLNHVSDRLRNDREIVMAAVRSNGEALKFSAQALKSDKEIALEAMNNNLEAFQFISKDLKQDEEFIKYCLEKFKITSLKGINESLMKKRDIVFQLVSNGMALSVTPIEFRNDREIVLSAVSRRGSDLQFTTSELKADEEIVRTAIKQNSSSLEYANESFQINKEFVLESIGSRDSENCYLHPSLCSDRDFIWKVIRKNGYLLQKTPFKDELDMILEACKSNPFYLYKLKLFQPGLFHFKPFALQVVAMSGSLLQLFDERIKRDKEIVVTALENDWNLFSVDGISSLSSISPDLIKDIDFMREVVELICRKRI